VSTRSRAAVYGIGPLLALALSQGLQSGEQISLSQAAESLRHEFHTNDAVLGLLPFAMAASGVAASFPYGFLTDRRRRTTLLAVAMGIWTVFIGLAGLATSLLMLFVMRAGLGAIEASSMASISLIGDYYPVQERAKRIGQWSAGALLGSGVAFGLGGPLIDAFSWRAAFFMWVPFGIISTIVISRQPEPKRGEQDHDFGVDSGVLSADVLTAPVRLPQPRRVGSMDYERATLKDVFTETFRIPTFWLATTALTTGNLLLNSVQFWGIPYFQRVHHLSTSQASLVSLVLGVGSGLGIVLSGVIADRLMQRGVVNARLHVGMVASVLAVLFLTPAWLIGSLWVSGGLFFLGGLCLTLPIPATDAVVTDVVVAELRGRAIMVRSLARIVSTTGPFIVGGIAFLAGGTGGTGLRTALAVFTPVYALGAIALWRACRHYSHDLAFVCAESERVRLLKAPRT
jgi:predicted MFS family arabinose efflux permease